MKQQKIPFKQALVWIFTVTFLVSGSVTVGYLYYLNVKEIKEQDHAWDIQFISQKEQKLDTAYLAQIMGLSEDLPVNLYQFDLKQAEKKLTQSPVIKSARIEKVPPATLWIDYALYQPYAILADLSNTVVDDAGVLMPIDPFFFLENFPVIYCGTSAASWGEKIGDEKLDLAKNILDCFETFDYNRIYIDLSRAFAQSFGKREVIVLLDEKFLRLTPENFVAEIENYQTLEIAGIAAEASVVDLRIEKLAFITPK